MAYKPTTRKGDAYAPRRRRSPSTESSDASLSSRHYRSMYPTISDVWHLRKKLEEWTALAVKNSRELNRIERVLQGVQDQLERDAQKQIRRTRRDIDNLARVVAQLARDIVDLRAVIAKLQRDIDSLRVLVDLKSGPQLLRPPRGKRVRFEYKLVTRDVGTIGLAAETQTVAASSFPDASLRIDAFDSDPSVGASSSTLRASLPTVDAEPRGKRRRVRAATRDDEKKGE